MNPLAALEQMLHVALTPVRHLLELAGLHPTDLQAWCLVVSIGILAVGLTSNYGDLILRRRGIRTTGTVVSIDESGDSPTPRIAFRDKAGRSVEFGTSLPASNRTNHVGGQVNVIYDPLKPERAREADRPIVKLALDIVLYVVAAFPLAYALFGQWMQAS